MPAGRPRTSTPEPEECEKLGQELLEWAKEENESDPHCRFAQWYSLEKMIPRKIWKSMVQRPEFVPYYEMAQALLAKRVMDPKVMDKSFGHRYLRCYDREVVESENEELEHKAQIAKQKQEESAEDQARKIVDAIKEIQS